MLGSTLNLASEMFLKIVGHRLNLPLVILHRQYQIGTNILYLNPHILPNQQNSIQAS